jgi:hypothetical protein
MSANILARRPAHRRSVSSGRLFRAGLIALLFFMLPVAANAYTLVLRSGRVLTVSDKFKVTPAAITYEASPGYWVTVWLSNIDFAATERANSEPAGSFAGRIKRESEWPSAAAAQGTQAMKKGRGTHRKVITNKDLEPTRLMREAQEKEYERTRLERGMPSRQEMRERIEDQDRWLSEWAQRMQDERMEAELESLKYELVNVRLYLDELSLNRSQQGTTYVPAYAPSNYYPYFYAPSTHLALGHRGLYGRARFGRHPHGRPWLYHPRPGRPFPRITRPSRGGGVRPRSMSTGTVAPRHAR